MIKANENGEYTGIVYLRKTKIKEKNMIGDMLAAL